MSELTTRFTGVLPWLKGIAAFVVANLIVVFLFKDALRFLIDVDGVDGVTRAGIIVGGKLLFMALTALLAEKRNRFVAGWVGTAFFLDLAFIILLFLPNFGFCPECKAKNLVTSTRCGACGYDGSPRRPRAMVEHDFDGPLHAPREMTERDL